MSEVRSIRLVCTGSAAKPHRPRPVFVWRMPADVEGLTVDTLVPHPESWMELQCGSCPQNPRIGNGTIARELERALAELRRGEWSVTLDIRKLRV